MLDKILGKKDKDKNDTPDLRKNGKKPDSDSDIGGRLKDMVGKVSGKPKMILSLIKWFQKRNLLKEKCKANSQTYT